MQIDIILLYENDLVTEGERRMENNRAENVETTEKNNAEEISKTEQRERDRKQYGNDFNRFMYNFGTMILLNIYFLICSLPVVTIGASLTAAENVCFKIREDGDVHITGTFFKTFGKNVINSTLVWIVCAGFLSAFAFVFYRGFCITGKNAGIAMCVAGIVGAAAVLMCMTYVFLLIGRYENDLFGHISNAFRMGFGHL